MPCGEKKRGCNPHVHISFKNQEQIQTRVEQYKLLKYTAYRSARSSRKPSVSLSSLQVAENKTTFNSAGHTIIQVMYEQPVPWGTSQIHHMQAYADSLSLLLLQDCQGYPRCHPHPAQRSSKVHSCILRSSYTPSTHLLLLRMCGTNYVQLSRIGPRVA